MGFERGESLPSRNEQCEPSHIGEFRQALSRLAVSNITIDIDVSQPQPDQQAREQFLRTDFKGQPTFYAVPEISHELAEDLVGFEPFVSRGGASRHGVFFGALQLRDGAQIPVAVKPHAVESDDVFSRREAEASCLKDYFTNIAAKKCGFESLRPVGLILDETAKPYSVTLLDDSFTSLDTINWTRFFEPGYETTGMREHLYKVALQTAYLHDLGDSFHGDLAPRNIAVNIHGQIFLIDWEYGTISTSPSKDVEERFGKTWKDVKTLMVELAKPTIAQNPGIGLFTHCQGNWFEEFQEFFLDDYMETRRIFAQQGSHHMRKVKETEDELRQLESSLKMEMDRWELASKQALTRS